MHFAPEPPTRLSLTDHRPPTTFPVSQSTPNAALLLGSLIASTRRVGAGTLKTGPVGSTAPFLTAARTSVCRRARAKGVARASSWRSHSEGEAASHGRDRTPVPARRAARPTSVRPVLCSRVDDRRNRLIFWPCQNLQTAYVPEAAAGAVKSVPVKPIGF